MAPGAPPFHFFTLLTKDEQYDAMRRSLEAVGFDETNALFTVLDNRGGNAHEPYSGINEAVRTAQAPYVVFCHQDLLFQSGPEALLETLRELEAKDPNWAVAGNAGRTPRLRMAFCLDDHTGSHDAGDRPAKVLTLDENFLIIKRDAGVGCSPELSGFHLYATDLCLNAYLKGRSAYVISYRLEHKGSSLDYAGLHKQGESFDPHWRKRIGGAVIMTPSTIRFFAPFSGAFKALRRPDIQAKLLWHPDLLLTIDFLLRPWRPKWLPTR